MAGPPRSFPPSAKTFSGRGEGQRVRVMIRRPALARSAHLQAPKAIADLEIFPALVPAVLASFFGCGRSGTGSAAPLSGTAGDLHDVGQRGLHPWPEPEVPWRRILGRTVRGPADPLCAWATHTWDRCTRNASRLIPPGSSWAYGPGSKFHLSTPGSRASCRVSKVFA